MSELPKGWATARVGELIDMGLRTDCSDETEVGFVPLQRLGVLFRSRHSHEPRRWHQVKKGYTHFQNGDVLLARITPSFENGKAGIVRGLPNGIGAGSTEYFVCRPIANVLLPEFLLAHFKTLPFLSEGESVMSGAVGQQRVPKNYVLASMIKLAPFAEQRRIVDKLDSLLARVDACRERLDRVPGILKRFRQAVLAAATSGELTREWREMAGATSMSSAEDDSQLWPIPQDWTWTQAGRVCEFITKGTTPSKDKMSECVGDVPYIKVYNLTLSGQLDFSVNPTFVDRLTHRTELRRSIVFPGDVLLNIVGPPLGKVSIVTNEYPEWNINQAIARFRTRFLLNNYYLSLCLMNQRTIDYATRKSRATAGQFNLTLETCRSIPIPLPPIDEQHVIVARVRSLFAYADSLDVRCKATRLRVDNITPSLLAKAFRGELVPQDPNDEPASELLARIRAAGGVAESKKPGRGRAKASQT